MRFSAGKRHCGGCTQRLPPPVLLLSGCDGIFFLHQHRIGKVADLRLAKDAARFADIVSRMLLRDREGAQALAAFAHREIESVTAETLPDLTASIRVMEKCGMRFVGDGNPEEGQRTVRYAITRNQLRVGQ